MLSEGAGNVARTQEATAQLSRQVALESLKGQETVTQLAARYEVHPGQIQAWKKALVEGASGNFGNGQDRKARPLRYQSDAPLELCYDFGDPTI